MTAITSSKPYLVRAIYEWILDNNLTPFIAVDTTIPEVFVPKKFIKDDKIVLNIAPIATHNLRIGNDALEFQARFSGISHDIYVPIAAIMAIYASENNQGMMFPKEESSPQTTPAGKPKPKLSVIQGGADESSKS